MSDENKEKPLSVAEQVAIRKQKIKDKELKFTEEREQSLAPEDEKPPVQEQEEEPPVEDKPPAEEKEEEPPVEKKEEEETEETPAEDKPIVQEEEDDFDFDFDFGEEEEEEKSPGNEVPIEEIPPADDEPESIKVWRARVKEQGAARKTAETQIVEHEQTIDKLEKEIEDLKKSKQDVEADQINWSSHNTVKPMWDKFDQIVSEGARTFTDAGKAQEFQKDSQTQLLQEYYDAIKDAGTSAEVLTHDIDFKAKLADRYGVEDGTPLLNAVKGAMEQYMSIQETVDELRTKYNEGKLSRGAEDYDHAVQPYQEVFTDLGVVDEDYASTNPDAVETIVSEMIKNDPDVERGAKKFASQMQQLIFGLRPLTQKELDNVEKRAKEGGITLQEYLENREKRFNAARVKFIREAFDNHIAMKKYGEYRGIYNKYEEAKKKRAAAKKALKGAKEREDDKPEEKKVEEVRPKDREYIPPSRRFGN